MEEGRCRQRLTFLTLGYSPSTAASALWSHMPLPNAAVPMELCHSCTTIRMLKNDEIGTHNRAGALQSSHRSTGTRTHTAHTHTHTHSTYIQLTQLTQLSLSHTLMGGRTALDHVAHRRVHLRICKRRLAAD